MSGGPDPAGPAWRRLTAHRRWLDDEFVRLLGFPTEPRHPDGGFAWLDATGHPDTRQPVHTWIAARMTHVHALAHLRGLPGSGPLVDHGVDALRGLLRDPFHGGWVTHSGPDGQRKDAYTHAFVVLAASSATAAGRPGTRALLDDALGVLADRFLERSSGLVTESFAADWTDEEAYRGANSNMHTVEALLAAGDVTGEPAWHGHALGIASFLVDDVARAHGWRLIEHFDRGWAPQPEYRVDEPDHPFRPYGTTVGHWLEWARLLLHLEASLDEPPRWLAEAAQALFAASVEAGWQSDGVPGFPYTLGWRDEPVVCARLHWVVAEAIGAAAALHERTGHPSYETWYRTFWDHAARYFIDPVHGSWHHELTPDLQVAAGTWSGKPDLYHAAQACLLPQARLAPALAPQLAEPAVAEPAGR
ncbi:AGE family epimerase/isomerase [Egibacter rhizosphaerae]|uniref:AGE family epimerase/isomerase n=1 Tax=Egibacter rhizosphaerae TaxID=1670831 RepID=A0A411YCA6_9ACTN|nr:AGE family epimerase/isomerase [Egibacter rhizosphaerae]QBI18792.1 AGE family epimerase/isomerase [Egibacter rhizosphaerae]